MEKTEIVEEDHGKNLVIYVRKRSMDEHIFMESYQNNLKTLEPHNKNNICPDLDI